MNLAFNLAEIHEADPGEVGGKARALAALLKTGCDVPKGLCVPCSVYRRFMQLTGTGERIQLELSRKPLEGMRWEEVWDAALRIRNLFLRTDLPGALSGPLIQLLQERFGEVPVVVRSSAPGEDADAASFAGLHESFVNVRGAASILAHVKRVWASLWSDGALLYRKELNLDTATAAMAVVVQECVAGDASGVAFSRDPNGGDRAVIEAVYGLNQGLVDGTIQPDRWFVERTADSRVEHQPAHRAHAVMPSASGTRQVVLPPARVAHPPLSVASVYRIYRQCLALEQRFGSPQDMEWTLAGERLLLLQARPITTAKERSQADDPRVWYRSLTRTFDNLRQLRRRIEAEILPTMLKVASELAAKNPAALGDAELAEEIERRRDVLKHWTDVYWTDLIPFAHGVRLFGQYYNDTVRPDNPYEFVDLLVRRDFSSVNRNESLEALAQQVRAHAALHRALASGASTDAFPGFQKALRRFLREHGDLTSPLILRVEAPSDAFLGLLLRMAGRPARSRRLTEAAVDLRVARFLAGLPPERIQEASDMLDLARVSYQLRDDDNIYLQGIEAQYLAAVAAGRRRLLEQGTSDPAALSPNQVVALLKGLSLPPAEKPPERSLSVLSTDADAAGPDAVLRARQLIGQPSGPGLASGPARVITRHDDLLAFQNGDVLVCDAISPTMTFVVPLAAAIVERRGGMLIHGAIIAREYGIPCVTGVEDATRLIQNGSHLTVDGYLGVVRIGEPPPLTD